MVNILMNVFKSHSTLAVESPPESKKKLKLLNNAAFGRLDFLTTAIKSQFFKCFQMNVCDATSVYKRRKFCQKSS
jgi:hypothetical protein